MTTPDPEAEKLNPLAREALRNNQRQLDMDGVEVGVSRQALEELLAAYDALSARPKPSLAATDTIGLSDTHDPDTLLYRHCAPEPGQEMVEFVAQLLHDEGGFDEAWDATWPEHPNDTGQREGGFVRIVPSDVQAKFRDVARRLLGSAALAALPSAKEERESFQARVQPWMMACFGPEISADRLERNDRFMEEALELVQASGYPKERAYALIEYVYGRDQGEINQEVGGVMVTLAAHCLAHGVDMHEAAETELARIWTKVEQIRAKQAAKPTGSALPVAIERSDHMEQSE